MNTTQLRPTVAKALTGKQGYVGQARLCPELVACSTGLKATLNRVEWVEGHSVLDEGLKFIPFSFTIKLPPPVKARMITARDRQGKILHSVPAVI